MTRIFWLLLSAGDRRPFSTRTWFAIGLFLGGSAASALAQSQAGALAFTGVEQWFCTVEVRIDGVGHVSGGNGEYRDTSISRRLVLQTAVKLDPGQASMIKTLNASMQSVPKEISEMMMTPQVKESLYRRRFTGDPTNRPQQNLELSVNDELSGRYAVGNEGHAYMDHVQETSRGGESRAENCALVLTLDLMENRYDLAADWNDLITVSTRGVATHSSRPGSSASRPVTGVKLQEKGLRLPGAGLVISDRRALTVDELGHVCDPATGKFEGTISWTLSPEPPTPLELIVDVVDYEKWLPEADVNLAQPGPHPLIVKAHLQKKGGGEALEAWKQLSFELTDVSREPGVCLNAPETAAGATTDDLQFLRANNPSVTFSKEGRRIESTTVGINGQAVLDCFDWGASATLTVDAITESGQVVHGRLPPIGGDSIRIPKRAAGSKIAASWLKTPVADASDEDDSPVGNSFKGDGLSAYEEYRGFYINGVHVRSDPTHKDFFIRNRNTEPRVKAAITLFSGLTKLEVHEINEDEMVERKINFNGIYAHLVDQHGVIIETPGVGLPAGASDYMQALPLTGKWPGTPKDFKSIVSTVNAYTVNRIPDNIVVTIAHELLHTCHVMHHGDVDLEVEIEVKPDPTTGNLIAVERAIGGKPGASDRPVTLLKVDGSAVPLTKAGTYRRVIGQKGGVYSGAADCIMRYNNADFLVDPAQPDIRYIAAGSDPGGMALCTSKAGTGVNAPADGSSNTHPQKPWFGDATVGNCAGQVAVSDLQP